MLPFNIHLDLCHIHLMSQTSCHQGYTATVEDPFNTGQLFESHFLHYSGGASSMLNCGSFSNFQQYLFTDNTY